MASKATVRHATQEGIHRRVEPSHNATQKPKLTQPPDVPTILALIHELAAYENATHDVLATESTLLATLSFPATSTSAPQTGYAHTLLLIDPDTTVAGMALYFTNYSTWRAAPGIYLEDLFVRPAYRKRGYGKRLLGELAREVRRIGGKRLEWSVLKWNESSIGFYEGLGASRLEEWVGMRVDGEGLVGLAEWGLGLQPS